VPADLKLIDIAYNNTLFARLWYFTKFDDKGNYFLLDMNANFQCLFTFGSNGKDNKIDINLK
jgi:hypothetical protein